jgi:hypothetical protein
MMIPVLAWKSLSVAPGSKVVTEMPVPRSSSRSDSAKENPNVAAFVLLQAGNATVTSILTVYVTQTLSVDV